MRNRGFTLLELLLATAILAMVMATLHIVLVGAIEAPRAVAESLRGPLLLAAVQDVIRTDLEAIALYCEPDDPVKLRDTGRSKEFEFVRYGPPLEADAEKGGLYRVTYKLSVRADGSKRLGRREEIYRPGGTVRVYSTNPELERFTALLRNVEDFTVELYEGGEWRGKWRGGTAPAGARITIVLASGRKGEFVVFLPVTSTGKEGGSSAAAE